MEKDNLNKRITDVGFATPARYCIKVLGEVSQNFSDYFGGFEISIENQSEQKPITTLTGNLQDQAALMGVLNALNNMLLPILSIKALDINQEKE